MAESKEKAVHRLILAIVGAIVLLSVICNLAFAWRYVGLNRDLMATVNRLQALNTTQQSINAIAQDLVNITPQVPWLVPILQKYNLHPPQAAQPQAAQPQPQPQTAKKAP